MATSVRIAVDAMGGDYGPRITVPSLAETLHKNTSVSALLFGDQLSLNKHLSALPDKSLQERIEVYHCPQQVEGNDRPSNVIRNKRDSSMAQAIKAVAEGEADACISAGNTGALMAFGLLHLKTLPGILRPAICTTMPTMQGHSYILDLGANLDCSPQHLHQFAQLGSLVAGEMDGIANPKVCLLNVGEEENKGGDDLKQAAQMMEQDPLINYCGYLEGDGIFQGKSDVIVCDGFVGNVALKSSEGLVKMVSGMFREVITDNWMTRVAAFFMAGNIRRLRARLDPSHYNGAYLLGLNGVVVKSHGGANKQAYSNALQVAIDAAGHNLPEVLSPILKEKVSKKKVQDEE